MSIISVIIPVFNGEKTIAETVNSVLEQTFSQFELIIINAGSTDSTLEIISSYQDPRIKIFSAPKANVAVNRNLGAFYSIGEFVTFLDADDLWTPDKLEAQYQALLQNPEAAVVYSWTNCIDETGKFLRRCSYVKYSGDVYDKFLLDDFIGNGSNVMIRKNAFFKVGGFDESLSNAQDTDMWLRLAAEYDFTVVPKPQILYRISAISMSSNIRGLEESNLAVITRAFAHKKAATLQHLKPYSIANLYKYLSYKVLDTQPSKKNLPLAIIILGKTIQTDIFMLFKPVIFKALLKIMTMLLLPPQLAVVLFNKFPKFYNTSTFLGYEKTTY